jgi:hypothetical protein
MDHRHLSLSSDVRTAEIKPGGRRYAGWPEERGG